MLYCRRVNEWVIRPPRPPRKPSVSMHNEEWKRSSDWTVLDNPDATVISTIAPNHSLPHCPPLPSTSAPIHLEFVELVLEEIHKIVSRISELASF
jgi:hypothetical protein